MKFYVIWSDGRKFGPADINTLNQWIKEGRVNRDTHLENADTQQKQYARDVPGLVFPSATADMGGNDPILRPQDRSQTPGSSQQSSGQQPGGQQPTSGQPQPYTAGKPESPYDPLSGSGPSASPGQYQNPPQPAGSPYPRGAAPYVDPNAGKAEFVWSLVCSIVGFLACCCFPLPALGVYLGHRSKMAGNPNGKAAMIVGWVLFGIGVAYWIMEVILVATGAIQGFSRFPTT